MQYECKECRKAAVKQYQLDNKEACKARNSAWYQANREQVLAESKSKNAANRAAKLAAKKAYALAHADELKDIAEARAERRRFIKRRWYHENPDKIKATWRKSVDKNREKVYAAHREYAKKHPDKKSAWSRKYSKTHPAARIRNQHKRRAAKVVGGEYTLDEWSALCAKYGHRCLMCNKTGVKLTVDHVIPLARGGANDIANLQPLCRSCNARKHTAILDLR